MELVLCCMWINFLLIMTIKFRKKGFWQGRLRSFAFAWKGIVSLFRHEHNAQIHLCVAVIVIAAGYVLGISTSEWCAVSVCIGGVFMAEGFNTAIEALADKVSPGFDAMVGRAKDLAAGAVLLFVIAAVIVGIIVFLPPIMRLIR